MRQRFLAAICILAVPICMGGASAAFAEEKIVVVGDSLSSGHGLAVEQSWVSLLEQRLDEQGYEYEVVNASISGDTTAGGLARLPRLLETHEPAIVVIELGGNDGLRGQPIDNLRSNLAKMVELAEQSGAEVILTGIRIPPNYGPAYTEALAAVYPELAEEYDVPLVSFLMDGVALQPELMQADRIHPNAKGQSVMFENVWHVLEDLL
ncbi:MAG: arylesterase [Gammaproteobacteria bacterium]|nr:arylesterase [Gammaproteobacteria bacterium]